MNINTMVLPRPKPLSYSLSMSLLFHALFVLMLGRNFLLESVPPLLNESKTEFRIIPKRTPPPAIKQEIKETHIEKPTPITPVEAQPVAPPVAIKATLMPTATVASLPMAMAPQSIEPVNMLPHSSSRAQVIESLASSAFSTFSAEVKPRLAQTSRVAPRGYGRKALFQSGASASFAHKLNIATPLPRVSSTGSIRRAAGIRSSTSVKAFQLGFSEPRVATLTQMTNKEVLRGFLIGIQKVIASAKLYPEEERKALHAGKMKVAFTLLRNGTIEKLRLKEKSKYGRLNQAALDAVSMVVPFSGFPAGIIEDTIDIVIPFRFDLT